MKYNVHRVHYATYEETNAHGNKKPEIVAQNVSFERGQELIEKLDAEFDSSFRHSLHPNQV